jgi:hypothetical protein
LPGNLSRACQGRPAQGRCRQRYRGSRTAPRLVRSSRSIAGQRGAAGLRSLRAEELALSDEIDSAGAPRHRRLEDFRLRSVRVGANTTIAIVATDMPLDKPTAGGSRSWRRTVWRRRSARLHAVRRRYQACPGRPAPARSSA